MHTSNILLAAASMLLISCGSNPESTTAPQSTPVFVTVATPMGNSDNSISASGQIEASQTAAISTRVMGTINSITVKVGDQVSKGQLLATISDNDIQAKRAQTEAMIAEAEAHVAVAQKDFNRFTNLFNQQSATAKELEMATLQMNAAKSKLEAARQMRNEVNAMMSYATLRAPFAGTVTQKLAEAGSIASPGMPLLMIENSGVKQVSASIAESDIAKIKIGDEATVSIKSTNKIFTGKITQLNPSSQFTGSQYIIKVSVPQQEQNSVMPGMYANISIASATAATQTQRNEILVPQSSIVHRDELTGIYTVGNNNTALLRWVRLGKNYGDKVEVLSGLAPNETFVESAEGKLADGIGIATRK